MEPEGLQRPALMSLLAFVFEERGSREHAFLKR